MRPSCAAAILSCALLNLPKPAGARPDAPASLAVLFVVDQLRPDYFTRYGELPGGLGRLYRSGAVYPSGMQDHAITHTAPGHSTLLSGRTPASTNILTNDLGAGDTTTTLLEVGGRGASPRRFRGTALYDWMRAADPGARVLSVSRKDRGAILPVGRARAPVFWFVRGQFTTSTWYADSLPAWVRAWNGRGGMRTLAGRAWRPLLADAAYAEPDSVVYENRGRDFLFPHWLPGDSAGVAGAINYVPWMDSLTLDFALEGVRSLHLGSRSRPDLLVVSLSTTDAIGHRYGPDSREQHDQIVRLDRWLGWFLDSLGATVPPERTIFALSADHGVAPMAERSGTSGGRVSLDSVIRPFRRAIAAAYGGPMGVDFESGLLSADVSALRERGVDTDRLADSLARVIAGRPRIARVYTARSLAKAPAGDPYARRWRRHLPRDHEWLVAVVPRDGWVWGSPGEAHHGTMQADNITVPIIIAGRGVRRGIYPRRVRTTDIGPTLAAMLGVRPAEATDGTLLREALPPGAR
jgi:predicted AlkP superfamily pyrophosphatase or phosphodiesterase